MQEKRKYNTTQKSKKFTIATVAPIFNKKGYVGTSLSDIMTATGLPKGSVYHNFKNKDDLAIEAFKYNLAISSYGFFMKIMESPLSPLEKLNELLVGLATGYDDVIAMGGCPLLNTGADADDTHPQLLKMVQDALREIEQSFVSIIQKAIARQEIKKETSPDKTAKTFLTIIEGGFTIAKILNDRNYFDNSLEILQGKIDELTIKSQPSHLSPKTIKINSQ
jgi:AcrR family transcriptional regulator